MNTTNRNKPTPRSRELRLWPGAIIVLVQWIATFGVPIIAPDHVPAGVMVGLAAGLVFVLWWAFFSRAPGLERWGALVFAVVAVVATRSLLHESIARAGMGMVFFIYGVPILCLAFFLWAVASRNLSTLPRRGAMVAAVFLACGGWLLLRTAGVTGGGDWDFEWRWSATPEDRLLAAGTEPTSPSEGTAPGRAGAEWPGFRGANRDGVIRGTDIETDWSDSPPVELWRRPVGPGWSSFAVGGDLLYTQEQRGDDEVVSCYNAITGDLVWRHSDTARFWESQAGAGPRATPALADGLVYTLGATGILNALDAGDGAVVWSRNAATDTGAAIPGWGFSSSPLIVDDLVVVHAGDLVAYDRASGEPRWFGPDRGGSYSSPHRITIDGLEQIVMLNGAGATSVALADGTQLWEHPWSGGIVQPAVTADGDLLLSSTGMSGGAGMQRIAVKREAGSWTTEERWTSIRLKPNFSDFVVHEGQAYGFDGRILACIDLETGERRWKGGRYGSGQMVLLPDQDLLLVVSERGELALVEASPEGFTELARLPAIEGKTWNHPVLVGDLLLVRNGEEMVAFRLPRATA